MSDEQSQQWINQNQSFVQAKWTVAEEFRETASRCIPKVKQGYVGCSNCANFPALLSLC